MTAVPSRTALFSRHTPGGVFTINNEALNTGNIYWVNSATGTDSAGYGNSPDAPMKTLAFALSSSGPTTASQGDRIYVMEYHTEAITAASTISWANIGVSVIGLGEGNARPTFSWTTATTATMTMSSANCRISNCIFDLTGISALVSGIVISAAGCKVDKCFFLTSKAGTGTAPLQAILTTASADRLIVDSCQFIGAALTPTTVAAGTSAGICLVGGTAIQITNNLIHGWWTTSVGGIYGITTLTNNVLIANNSIGNQTASSASAIVLLTNSTGFIVSNHLGVLTGTAPVTADKCFEGGNVYVATQGVTAGTASTF